MIWNSPARCPALHSAADLVEEYANVPDEHVRLARLEAEHNNIQAAFE